MFYRYVYSPNVKLSSKEAYLYIPTGSDFSRVSEILVKNRWIINEKSFHWVAKRKQYTEKVKPGRYKILNGMSNNELVNLLRSGKQEPVMVRFQNIRDTKDFAGKISHQIEADSAQLLNLLRDKSFLQRFGVTPITSFVLFIPNTYEFFWNTNAEQFIERMNKEKERFWNEQRISRAKKIGLDVPQVVILASIVEKETAKDAEKPLIAGVYMNRLRKHWPLQADPTLIFAWNDYSIRRVRGKHLQIDSPYNTYKNIGLPPGPICLPSIASINSVLNYAKHNYMFFCAKDDLSCYHAFAANYDEHMRNARRYQRAIGKMEVR